VDQLVEATRNDIRQIINILSTYRLSQDQMSFDQAKTVYVLRGILTVFVLGNYRL
jgi:replication factor C subunit 1